MVFDPLELNTLQILCFLKFQTAVEQPLKINDPKIEQIS